MSVLKRYVFKVPFKAPYIRVTGNPRRPTKICGKQFKQGEIIAGELKHAQNKPAIVLTMIDGVTLPVPLEVVRELQEKEIGSDSASSADGQIKASEAEKKVSKVTVSRNPKIQYINSGVAGLLLGLGAVVLAEKKGWLDPMESKKNKLYAMAIGAVAGMYILYVVKDTIKNNKKE